MPRKKPPEARPSPAGTRHRRRQSGRIRSLACTEDCFAGSALPLTMELAGQVLAALRIEMREILNHWPDDDRVLALLLPSLIPDIEKFHRGAGPSLLEILRPAQVEHLDTSLLRRLCRRLDRRAPGFEEVLRGRLGEGE